MARRVTMIGSGLCWGAAAGAFVGTCGAIAIGWEHVSITAGFTLRTAIGTTLGVLAGVMCPMQAAE